MCMVFFPFISQPTTTTMPTKTRSVDKNFKAPSVPCKEIENRSKGLDPERRKKLEDIRARELLKEKTQQLRHILIKKLTLKFGRYLCLSNSFLNLMFNCFMYS